MTDSAVITGDGGIRREAQKNGIKVIIANNEKIILKGYGNGFIGGASGLIAPNTVCFTGNTDDIVDISEIKALGFDTVVLKNADMTDVGGIVPIMQVSK